MSFKKKNNLKEEKENKYKLILNDLYDIKGLYNLYLNHKNENYNFPEKSKLKSIIFNAFKMNNEKELYDYFYNEYLNSEIDNHDLKALTKVFIFFIEKEIINKNENENLKNSSLKLFYSKIIDSDINNINSFLILFNIKSEFINSIDENNFIDPKFLNLIQEFELQNKIDYHKLYIKKLNLNLIFSLLNTYKNNQEEVINYLISIKKKKDRFFPSEFIPFLETNKNYFQKIIENFILIPNKNDQIENLNFLIIQTHVNNNNNNNFNKKNKNLINHNFLNSLNNFLNSFIHKKDYENAIYLFNKISPVYKEMISKKLLTQLIYSLPYDNVNDIITLLNYLPNEIENVLYDFNDNKRNKEGLQIIKKINYTLSQQLFERYNDFQIFNYFNYYKIRETEEEKTFDILFDYALIKNKYLNIVLDCLFKRKQDEKAFLLIHFGLQKNFEIEQKFYNLYKKRCNLNKLKKLYYYLIPEDKFGPHDPFCITLGANCKVKFIDKLKTFNDFSKNFKDSNYFGIDCEWKQSIELYEKDKVSIMQICDFEEKNVMLLDLKKLNFKEFYDSFEKLFKNKIFIGYSFDKNDIENLPEELQNFFNKIETIQIDYLYQFKYLKKPGSLAKVCKEILENKLEKYEQKSNWDLRPLKQSQKHYAALDAIVCVKIYKKLIN